MDWMVILEFLKNLAPWVSTLLMILGSLVVVGLGVDAMIPDEQDKGFMKKAMVIPVLGDLLKSLARFSPFNYSK